MTNYVIIKLLKCKRPMTIKWAMEMIDRANKDGLDDIAEMIDDCLDGLIKPNVKKLTMDHPHRMKFIQTIINKFMDVKGYWIYFAGGRIFEVKDVDMAKGKGLKIYTKNNIKDVMYEVLIEDANSTVLKQLAIGRNEPNHLKKPQYVKILKGGR